MNIPLAYILYAVPFIVAAYVLVRAKFAKPVEQVEDEPVVEKPLIDPEEAWIKEGRSRPIHCENVSYGV